MFVKKHEGSSLTKDLPHPFLANWTQDNMSISSLFLYIDRRHLTRDEHIHVAKPLKSILHSLIHCHLDLVQKERADQLKWRL